LRGIARLSLPTTNITSISFIALDTTLTVH
jgi:hypothetical protein